MKYLLLLLILFTVACTEERKKEKSKGAVDNIVTENTDFIIEVPNSFTIQQEQVNELLLVVVPNQQVSFQVDNQGVAQICDGNFGTSLCFNSAGIVTVTATNSSNQNITKTIEVFGPLNFEVDKTSTVTVDSLNNRINLNTIGGVGAISYTIDEGLGDVLGSIVGNQFIPPNRDRLMSYLSSQNRETDYVNIFIKAQDERGNSAIQEISLFASAVIDISQQVPIVCDSRNILSNSYFLAIEGGLPGQYVEVDEGTNITVSEVISRNEENAFTIFKINTNGECDNEEEYTLTLKDMNDNFIDLNVLTVSGLESSLNKDRYKDDRSSALRLIEGEQEGENTLNSATISNNSDQVIDLELSGARAPYRVFISSPKTSQDLLPDTSTTLKLALNELINISSEDYDLYLRRNSQECAPIAYREENENSVAQFLGTFEQSAQIQISELRGEDGFYRIVVADCNGVYADHDFYKVKGGLIDISNDYLNAGSPFSSFMAYFSKPLSMDISLTEFSSDQVSENLNSDFTQMFSRFDSSNPATCDGVNCLAFTPYKLFENVDDLEPAKVNISLTDSAGITFELEKYIYPGFKFHYMDRATGEYRPFSYLSDKEYFFDVEYTSGSEENLAVRENLFNERLSRSQSASPQGETTYEFLGAPRDIKITGGIGLLKLLQQLEMSEEFLTNVESDSPVAGVKTFLLNSGQRNLPWMLNCIADEHNNASFGYARNNYYTIENDIKSILIHNAYREFDIGQTQDTLFFSSPLSGSYRYINRQGREVGNVDFTSYQTYNSNPAQLDPSNLIDKRIEDCISNSNDPCEFWTENLDFIYPESRLGSGNTANYSVNNTYIPWLSRLQAQRFLNEYSVAKVSRKMKLGAALDKNSDQLYESFPDEANLLSVSGNLLLYHHNIEGVDKVCINSRTGFNNAQEIDLSGWELTQNNKSLCHEGINLYGGLVFPFSHGVFYYQTSQNSAISKLLIGLQGTIIRSLRNDTDLINEKKSNNENSIYKLINAHHGLVYVETSFYPEDDDNFTCSDYILNTNLLVIKNNNLLGNEFTSKLYNYIPDNNVQTRLTPADQDFYKTVTRKTPDCVVNNFQRGILKINKSNLDEEFLGLNNFLPEDISGEDLSKYIVTDYAMISVAQQSNLYIAGVRKDHRTGIEHYSRLVGDVRRTRTNTLSYDAPFLIKADFSNLQNNHFKIYERPTNNYICHRKTKIDNVQLFTADARESYPNGNVGKTVNLIFNIQGSYHELPFNQLDYNYSLRTHIGYLALDKNQNLDFFYRLVSNRFSTRILKKPNGMSDLGPIVVEEKGTEFEFRDDTSGYFPFTRIKSVQFIDFRER